MDLSQAITNVETAGAAYASAVLQTVSDKDLAAKAQAKADAAAQVVSADMVSQSQAATDKVTALKDLLVSAQAEIDSLNPPA